MILNAIMLCLAFAIFVMVGYFVGFEKAKKKFDKPIFEQKIAYYQPDCVNLSCIVRMSENEREYLKTDKSVEDWVKVRMKSNLGEAILPYVNIERTEDFMHDEEVYRARVTILDRRIE